MSFAEIEQTIGDFGTPRRGEQAPPRRAARRHVHDHQRRRLRLAALDADRQPAAKRHPRPARHPGPPGRPRRPGRHPPDDVRRPHLRPPHRRRPRSGDLPEAHQGRHRRPDAAVDRSLAAQYLAADSHRRMRCGKETVHLDQGLERCSISTLSSSASICVHLRLILLTPEVHARTRPPRHRRRTRRLRRGDPRRAARPERRLRRERSRARRHLPAHRLHPQQGPARIERALPPRPSTRSPSTASRPAT